MLEDPADTYDNLKKEEAVWRAAAERLHRQQEEYMQLLEREATRTTVESLAPLPTGADLEGAASIGAPSDPSAMYAAQRDLLDARVTSAAHSRTREVELERGLAEQTAAHRRLGAEMRTLQDNLNASHRLSTAAAKRHEIELALLVAELSDAEDRGAAGATDTPAVTLGYSGYSMARASGSGVGGLPKGASELSVEGLRKRAEAAEAEGARLHAALQQQARAEQAEQEVRRLRQEADVMEQRWATERMFSGSATLAAAGLGASGQRAGFGAASTVLHTVAQPTPQPSAAAAPPPPPPADAAAAAAAAPTADAPPAEPDALQALMAKYDALKQRFVRSARREAQLNAMLLGGAAGGAPPEDAAEFGEFADQIAAEAAAESGSVELQEACDASAASAAALSATEAPPPQPPQPPQPSTARPQQGSARRCLYIGLEEAAAAVCGGEAVQPLQPIQPLQPPEQPPPPPQPEQPPPQPPPQPQQPPQPQPQQPPLLPPSQQQLLLQPPQNPLTRLAGQIPQPLPQERYAALPAPSYAAPESVTYTSAGFAGPLPGGISSARARPASSSAAATAGGRARASSSFSSTASGGEPARGRDHTDDFGPWSDAMLGNTPSLGGSDGLLAALTQQARALDGMQTDASGVHPVLAAAAAARREAAAPVAEEEPGEGVDAEQEEGGTEASRASRSASPASSLLSGPAKKAGRARASSSASTAGGAPLRKRSSSVTSTSSVASSKLGAAAAAARLATATAGRARSSSTASLSSVSGTAKPKAAAASKSGAATARPTTATRARSASDMTHVRRPSSAR